MAVALGHVLVPSERTGEEIAMQLLGVYYGHGSTAAGRVKAQWPHAGRQVLLMHALVEGM